MYCVLNCHKVAKHTEFYMGYLQLNVTFTDNAGCSKKGFTMVYQILLRGQCYEKVHTKRHKTINLSIRKHRTLVKIRQTVYIRVVRIATGCVLDDGGVGVRVSLRSRIFVSPYCSGRLCD
jgi:hypothetical protein